MDCNIIRDLLPLYIDNCCSKESAELIEDHMTSCADCKIEFESMSSSADIEIITTETAHAEFSRIKDWKASVMNSVLLFISFVIIIIGVYLESATPMGDINGFWACALIVPSTAFMLSLMNWYFVRVYSSRKMFSVCSCLLTFILSIFGYIWAVLHYKLNIFGPITLNFDSEQLSLDPVILTVSLGIGAILTVVFCVLSKTLSNEYAKMLSKE